MRRERLLPIGLLLVSVAYAVVRYVIFGNVSPAQIPLFIANKAIAVSGLGMIGLASGAVGPTRKSYGMVGFLLTLLHVLITLSIFTPAYFPKLFLPTGLLQARVELSMLAGAVGMMVLYVLSITPSPATASPRLIPGAGRLVLALTAGHVLALGYPSWGTPREWPGWLPPITLLSFLLAIGLLARRH